jgi:serpin B
MTHTSCFFTSKSHGIFCAGVLAAVLGCDNANDIGSLPEDHDTSLPQEIHSDASYDAAPAVSTDDYQRFVAGVNDFGLDVFRRKATASDANLVFSPVSLDAALSMAYAGAAGDTAAEMRSVLRDPFGSATYHEAMNQLTIDLRSRNLTATSTEKPLSIDLSLLNSVWFDREIGILTPYLDVLATSYNAGVRLADFLNDAESARLAINKFASDSTKGLITDLLAPGDVGADTQIVLANALYLKASWAEPFAATSTVAGNFRLATDAVVSVPMMHASRDLDYYNGTNFEAVSLPYVGQDLSMLIVLPATGEFTAVRDAMDASWVETVANSLTSVKLNLTLPKFQITWGTENFNSELAAMGMPGAFADTANFSGMSNKTLYISQVMQKAYVGVDESGTEAAAASAVLMQKASIVITSLTVDHPFLFAIRDKSGALLFVGQVTDPSQ